MINMKRLKNSILPAILIFLIIGLSWIAFGESVISCAKSARRTFFPGELEAFEQVRYPDPDQGRPEEQIQKLAEFINSYPSGGYREQAFEMLANELNKLYPSSEYNWSIGVGTLLGRMLSAIEQEKPLVVTFVAKEVSSHNRRWSYWIHLMELGGEYCKIEYKEVFTSSDNFQTRQANPPKFELFLRPYEYEEDSYWLAAHPNMDGSKITQSYYRNGTLVTFASTKLVYSEDD